MIFSADESLDTANPAVANMVAAIQSVQADLCAEGKSYST